MWINQKKDKINYSSALHLIVQKWEMTEKKILGVKYYCCNNIWTLNQQNAHQVDLVCVFYLRINYFHINE